MATNRSRALLRRLTVKIILPSRTVQRHIVAGPGSIFTEEGIGKVLESVADELEKIPGHEFRLVELGKGCFNFVCAGEKSPAGSLAPCRDA